MAQDQKAPREEVVAVAARLFEERGFSAVRAEDIAEALHIAKPTLYKRTKSKAELLHAVMSHVMVTLEQRRSAVTSDDQSPLATVEALIRHHMAEAMEFPSYFNVFFRDERELPAAAQREFQSWGRRYTSHLVKLLAAADEAGEITGTVDPRIAANSIIATANWVTRWHSDDGPFTRQEVIDQTWSFMLKGIRGSPQVG